MKKIISFLLLVNMLAITATVSLNQEQDSDTEMRISASRETYSLEESVEDSEAVLKVKIGNTIAEIKEGGFPQTVHEADVIETLKGNTSEKIKIIQDGTKSVPVDDNPLFEKGETYILVLKEADSTIEYDNAYWITDEYYVNKDTAVEIFPKSDNESMDLPKQRNSEISRAAKSKINELSFNPDVVETDELVEKIEEVTE